MEREEGTYDESVTLLELDVHDLTRLGEAGFHVGVEGILRETADVDFGGGDEFLSEDGFASFSFSNVVRMLSRTDRGRV